MRIVDKFRELGIDINVGNFVIFDENGEFVVQSETMDEAFAVSDEKGVKIPAVIDLNGMRNENIRFY